MGRSLFLLVVLAVVLNTGFVASASGVSGRTLIACLDNGRFDYRVAPRSCDLFARVDRGPRLVRDIRARHLRWTSWGSAKASAKGRSEDGGSRLSVIAYHRIRCGESNVYYRLAQVTVSPGGHTYRMKLARCVQRRF